MFPIALAQTQQQGRPMPSRITILSTLFALLTVSSSLAEGRPNIVLILADDMGYGDIGAYNPNSKIATPHLDSLVKTGMRFTDAHSGGSTCVPSRYALLTGRFAIRATLDAKRNPTIEPGRTTIASLLRENGYATSMVGKWHEGFEKNNGEFNYDQPLRGGPADQGFDSFFGMHASLDIPPFFYIRDRTPTAAPTNRIGAGTSEGGPEGWTRIQGAFWREGPIAPDFKIEEVTPRFEKEAVKLIRNHSAAKTEKPLFLYLALPSPHTPWVPTKRWQGKSNAGMYGDFVMQVDSVVGSVVAALKKAKMTDDTLIIFSSDNGPVWYDKDVEKFGHDATGVLKGMKGDAWEGGHRMPFIARWPDGIQAGATNNHLVSFADVLATFAELVGSSPIPKGSGEDSVSFFSALTNQQAGSVKRPAIIHGSNAIRDGDWKLITHLGSGGFSQPRRVAPKKGSKLTGQLYNLREDVGETNNRYLEYPELVERLHAKLKKESGK